MRGALAVQCRPGHRSRLQGRCHGSLAPAGRKTLIKKATQGVSLLPALQDELERLLVNVGASVRLGPQVLSARHQAAPPAAPPQAPTSPQLASAQQDQQQFGRTTTTASQGLDPAATQPPAAQPPASVQLQAQPAASPVQPGHSAPAAPPLQHPATAAASPADWRAAFDATLKSFEDRYSRLQAELQQARAQAGATPHAG